MRPSLVSRSIILLAALISSSSALLASTSSPCSIQCGNVQGSTTGDDITCPDDSYNSAAGTTFKSCVSCQIASTYVDPVMKTADLQLGLYNLRYAISWCLFGFPNNTAVGDTPCITSTACGPLENAFEFDSLSANATNYKYCALMPDVNVPKCNACLSQQSSEFYLANFQTALSAGCQQQPVPGSTISIQGSLFSTTPVNITTPSATPISTNPHPTGGLTLGAKVGIAVGAILLFLAVVGFCIICTGRRRRRKALALHQQQSGYSDWLAQQQSHTLPPSMTGPMQFQDSPQSQRPLVQTGSMWGPSPIEESPAHGFGEKVYFSPYSSQYSSPVSASEQQQVVGREWPIDRKGSLSGIVGGSLGRSRSIEKRPHTPDGDRIEMQNVPPVLLHPGNGRVHHGLTEDDAKRGQAL